MKNSNTYGLLVCFDLEREKRNTIYELGTNTKPNRVSKTKTN
jgi:hypothetical protein